MQFNQLKRLEFISLLGGAAAWPVLARAQQGERVGRIGVLTPFPADDAEGHARLTVFTQALQQSGWTVGQNVCIDYRWGPGNAATMRKYAAELVALAPDAILAHGSPAMPPLLQATRTVPIVSTVVSDPVAAGFVDDSLARPGGNATGFMNFEFSLSAEWLGGYFVVRSDREYPQPHRGEIHEQVSSCAAGRAFRRCLCVARIGARDKGCCH